MAELTYNDLLSQLSATQKNQFEGVFGSPGWYGNYQTNPGASMVTGHQDYDKFKAIADAGAQSKTLNKFNWGSLLGMGKADAAMPTDAETAAIERSGINTLPAAQGEGLTGTNVGTTYDQLMKDAWMNRRTLDTPGGTMTVDEETGVVEPGYGLGETTNIKAPVQDQWRLPDTDWGPVRPTDPLPERGKLDMFLQKFGAPPMTLASDADKLANRNFMVEQGIGRDQQTGRMIGGDFAGMNAPGTSAWGSANFGEMAQDWTDKYGDMVYKTDKQKQKQARMKEAAQAHAVQQQAIQQERIRNERARASAANVATQRDPTGGGAGGRHMGNITQAQASQVAAANAAAGMGGWRLAQGGRVGYSNGGRVGILSVF